MSLEAAAIILALLWGPTALWLIFRALRGQTGGTRESFVREPARLQTVQAPLEAVIRNEYWICKDCRSVNHLGAMQCYACGIKRPPPQPVAPHPTPTGNGWVATMDPGVGRRTPEPVPVTRLQPSSAVAPDRPVATPVPELAAEPSIVAATAAPKRPRTTRRAHTPAGGATAAELSVAAHMTAVPPAAIEPAAKATELAPDAARVAAAAAAASPATKRPRTPRRPHTPVATATAAELSVAADVTGAPTAAITPGAVPPAVSEPGLPALTPSIAPPPVCPYLGFEDDPATQCSYPDSRNVCHAAAANGRLSMPTPRRLVRGVRGGGRTLPISDQHQAKLCLTSAHPQCDRYPHPAAAPNKSR
jgi:hypothetical protein